MRRLVKRSLVLAGHSTSVALEPEFWSALERMAAARDLPLSGLIGELDACRGDAPLASAARVAALVAASLEGKVDPGS